MIINDEDRTYEALIRTPFKQVVNEIYANDPFGSTTFNCMNSDRIWRVQRAFEHIVVRNGWSVDEFNKQVHKEFNEQ